jgi:diguanylate cyclase (GGDEF)-like protein
VNEQLLREPLTGLPGRTIFLHRASRAIERARRDGTNVAVLYLDLDRFKTLNDSVGHLAGDRLLVAAAARIEEASRSQDVVARIGGDEFAILCEGVASPEEASGIADRIVSALDSPLDIDGVSVVPSASVGVALADPDVATPEELIARADLAMYRAKESGERCVVFGEALREEERRTLELEAALRLAVERGELRLLYQPIVSLSDGQVVGVEALLRWQHPTRGLLAPADFIPVAERTGAIVPIGEWVLREACRDAAGWTSSMYVSVNLSPRQFAGSDLVDSVATVLAETGVAPHRLAVEVTEGLLLDDSDQAVQTLRELASLGITIVIDDFGSGPASLGYLSRFPIGFLKLDRSILAKLEEEPERSEAILGAIAGMAKALGMTVVAGGVESERQLRTLRLLGWRFAQGFHLGGPQPAEAISELVADSPPAAAAG